MTTASQIYWVIINMPVSNENQQKCIDLIKSYALGVAEKYVEQITDELCESGTYMMPTFDAINKTEIKTP